MENETNIDRRIIKLRDLISKILIDAFMTHRGQIWNLILSEFFIPEMRSQEMNLDDIWAGQLLIDKDQKPVIRLNDEVKANIISSEYNQPEKDKIRYEDIEQAWGTIEGIELSSGEKGKSHAHFLKKDKEWWFEMPDMFSIIRELASTVGRICQECGRIFTPSKYKPNQKYCSDVCRQRAWRKKE